MEEDRGRTVNDDEDLRRLVDLGVHGIITDHPDRLTAILDDVPAPPEPTDAHAGGLELVRWMQDSLGVLTPVMRVITFLGDADFYLVVFPLLYWCVSRRIGIRVGVMLLLSAGLNSVLKLGVASPRPLFLDPEVGLVDEVTFGVPSGHAQNAVAVWGTLAAELRRRWAWAAATTLMLLLRVSRVHLGVHFPVDTVTGWAVGGLLLWAYVRWRDRVAAWAGRAATGAILAVALAVSLGLVAAAALVRTAFTGWEVPAAWVGVGGAGLEGGATGLGDTVTAAAALFGLVVGLVVLQRRGGFESAGPVSARLLRYPGRPRGDRPGAGSRRPGGGGGAVEGTRCLVPRRRGTTGTGRPLREVRARRGLDRGGRAAVVPGSPASRTGGATVPDTPGGGSLTQGGEGTLRSSGSRVGRSRGGAYGGSTPSPTMRKRR